MSNSKKILIIGSEGFIGSHLIAYYIQRNDEVWGCDLNTLIKINYHFLKNDLNPNFWNQLFEKKQFDYCINAGGKSNVNASVENPAEDFDANVNETFKILNAIRLFNKECKYLHISSAAVYGNPEHLPIKENAPCNPLSPYGWHKLLSEKICNVFSKLYNLSITIIRPFSVYGPGLKKQLFWDVYQKYKINPSEIELWGNGSETRDYVYIDDLVLIIEFLLNKSEMKCNTFNVASGVELSINEAIITFFESFELKPSLFFNKKNKPGNPINWKGSVKKLTAIGYYNKYDFITGISKTADWLKSNG
jgi:dTDP-glucose 4,6-dehydratase/UDP-glucose 4-epimerase